MPQRLAQHLIARGLLPARIVDEALRRLGRDGGSLDTVLLEMGAVSEAGILQAISDVSGVRLVNLADFEPNAEAAPLMPLKMAKQLNVVPLSVDGTALHLACAYPLQAAQLKDVGFLLGRKLELWVALEVRVRDWQLIVYKQPLEPRYQKLLSTLDPTRTPPAPPTFETETESLSPEVVDRLSRGIVDQPLLLDRPKTKKSPSRPKPKIEVVEEPIPLGAEEDDPKTSVLDPLAYSRFARQGETGDVTSESNPGLGASEDDHHSTRVMDISGYKNFAREVSNLPSVEVPKPRASNPAPPPAVPAFPGGVLPPRRSSSDSIPAKKAEPVVFVQPSAAARPPSERVRPSAGRPPSSATQKPVVTSAPTAQPKLTPPPVQQAPMTLAAPPAQDETDFSDINEVIASPSPPVRVPPKPPEVVPPEPPTPPDDTPRDYADAPLPEAPPEELTFTPLAPPAGAAALSTPLPPPAPSLPIIEAEVEVAPAPEPMAAPVELPLMAMPEVVSTPVTMPADFANTQGLLPAPPGLVASSATEWSLAQARAALRDAVSDREQLINVVLEYARRTFEFIGAFAVMRGAAVGWQSRGDGDPEVIRQLAVPLDTASVFRTVALTRGSYVGPLPPDALSQHYLALLGRMPRTVFMWPVEVQSKLVAILYGDCGTRPISQRRLADFILFCQDLPSAFHELILYRKQNPRVAQEFTNPDGVMPDPGYADDQAPQGPAADAEWFNGLITLLTGPDPSERSMAMQELMKSPDASARALARAFPGPTGWSRLPVVDLPEPDELGPLPGALARLGQAGASAIAPLLDHEDSDTRYLALLTSGSLRYPDVVDGVVRGLFDYEPDISSAARAASAALRLLPHFQSRLPGLRQELVSADMLRRSLAARALGVLHDRASIEGLINLTGSEDELCAQSAGDALKEITRAGFGTNPSAWSAWWARARELRRIEWLVEALMAEDFDLRLAAIEELSRTFGDNFGYFADGPDAERAGAVSRWQAIVSSRDDLDI